MCCHGGSGCCRDSILRRHLISLGLEVGGWLIILAPSMEGCSCHLLSLHLHSQEFHLNLEMWWQGLESHQTTLSDLWMNPIFLIKVLIEKTSFQEDTTLILKQR